MTALVHFEAAKFALEQARTIDEVKDIRDKAEALRLYMRQAGESLEMQNAVAEIKIRAERRAGDILGEMEKAQGARNDLTSSHDARKSTLPDLGISYDQSSRWQQIASVPEPLFEQHVADTKAQGEELTSASVIRLAKGETPRTEPAKKNAALFTSDSYEWYTPQHIIEGVYLTLDEIDLDPASSKKANQLVRATRIFTKEDNGLIQPWNKLDGTPARVYMNPPYGSDIGDWVNKLRTEYECGNVSAAITLLPARTDTAWMRGLAAFPRCFLWGRLKFSDSDNGATFPSVVIALGIDVNKFASAFQAVGDIYIQLRAE